MNDKYCDNMNKTILYKRKESFVLMLCSTTNNHFPYAIDQYVGLLTSLVGVEPGRVRKQSLSPRRSRKK